MGNTMFKVVFNHHGFMPGKDISEEELASMHDCYFKMYNQFANGFIMLWDKISDSWRNYELAKFYANEDSIKTMQKIMDIDETYDFNKWIMKWYKEIADAVDQTYFWSGLKSKIFQDEDGTPHYSVVFKKNPNWSMFATIKDE